MTMFGEAMVNCVIGSTTICVDTMRVLIVPTICVILLSTAASEITLVKTTTTLFIGLILRE